MTAVSQLVPNFFGGINEQPDELKKPGQVRDCVNFLPDVTYGLLKRPGMKWIDKLDGISGDGTWIEFDRNNQVGRSGQYLGYISNKDGQVFFWDLEGTPVEVKYSTVALELGKFYTSGEVEKLEDKKGNKALVSFDFFKKQYTDNEEDFYLDKKNRKALKTVSIKDNIIVTNPAIRTVMQGNSPPKEDEQKYYAFIETKVLDPSRTYTLKIDPIKQKEDDPLKTVRVVEDGTIIKTNRLNYNDYWSDKDLNLTGVTVEGESEKIDVSNDQDGNPTSIREPDRITKAFKIEAKLRGQLVTAGTDKMRYDFYDIKIVDGGEGFKEDDIIYIKMSEKNGNSQTFDLWFKVSEILSVVEAKDLIKVEAEDSDAGSIDNILIELKNEIDTKDTDNVFDKVEIIGNGIYLKSKIPFLVDTPDIDLFNILNTEKVLDTDNPDLVPIAYCNSVANLPIECKPNFKVRVRNSTGETDDVYFKFINSIPFEDEVNVVVDNSGQGFWQEIAKPYEPREFVNRTMPHMITCTGKNFVVSRINWKSRSAGTSKYNPSFIDDTAKITGINFFKNRLIFLTSVGTIITSSSENITDFFPKTALTSSISDPIDVISNTNISDPLYGSIVTNNGLVIFGANTQYQFFTNSDILSPSTVNVTQIANYEFEPNSTPRMLSTNISFVTNEEATRMYEMTNVFDRGQVDINERSKIVQAKFSKGYTHTSSSRIYNILAYSKPMPIKKNRTATDVELTKIMWLYVYLKDSSQVDQQTAWIRFEFPHPIKHHFFSGSKMFVITGNGNATTDATECYLTSLDVEAFDGATANPTDMPEFVDYWTELPEDLIPWEKTGNEDVVPSVFRKDPSNKMLPVNITGIKYNCQVDLPKYYVGKSDGTEYRADTTASLTMHRYKINHGAVGAYHVDIKRYGKDDYTMLYEQPYADGVIAGAAPGPNVTPGVVDYPIAFEQEQTVPIYDRNTNVNISIRSDFNLPCIIYSLRWEGDYTNRYYRRV